MDIATFQDFKQILTIKRYSANSITTYIGLLRSAQNFIGDNKAISRFDDHALHRLVYDLVKEKKYSYASQKQLIASLSLYFKEIHQRNIDFTSVYPTRSPKRLPDILSKNEVKRLLDLTHNLKHKTMLTTIYALGLRSGELTAITIVDIKSDRKQVFIRAAKGKRDRVLPISDKLIMMWREYYKKYQPEHFLFEGQNEKKYSAQSLRKVFHEAKDRAGIKTNVTLHSLRHSYATHLMDAGTDIQIIKELLGHNSIKTTLIYTQVTDRTLSKVKSPFEDL